MGDHVGRLGTSLSGAVTAYNKAIGSLESRVLVSARKLYDLGLSHTPLDSPAQIEIAPRQPSSPELLADAGGLQVAAEFRGEGEG
jgi:DNA recombination protein RmuC